MFNKYWREYPWFFQLFQFLLLVFICISFFSILGLAIPAITGVSAAEITNLQVDSPAHVRIAMLLTAGIGNMSVFLIPCALFAYAVHPQPLQYLGIRKPQDKKHWLIVLLLAIGTVPMISGIQGLIDMIPLSADLEAAKAKFAAQQKAMTNFTTTAEFLVAIPVLAIIPAIGEELLFRAVMIKFAAKKMVGTIFFPILLSAVFFGMAHGNTVGLISLIISGIILGYVYYLTGSLVMSMFAHFIVNGSQLLLIYFGRDNSAVKNMMDSNEIPLGLFAGGIILFALSFYWLWKSRTPLPKSWTNDFTPEELEQKLQDKNNY